MSGEGFDHFYRYSCWLVGDLLVTLGTDSDCELWTFISGTPEFCLWFISGFRLFRIPGLSWEYLFRGSVCHPFSGCSCEVSDVISGSVYFGTPQVGFMVTWSHRCDWFRDLMGLQMTWWHSDLHSCICIGLISHSSAFNPCLSVLGIFCPLIPVSSRQIKFYQQHSDIWVSLNLSLN